jgi:acetate kinase
MMMHLGNGASVCGARDARSQTSSMGFSAVDGLMMGSRSGALDPGVLLYLLEQGWDRARLEDLLYRRSGLLGVSGISADMRQLRADGSAPARFAIDLFVHRLVRECGAIMSTLGGLDVMAFSGGIGEHDADIRARCCAALSWHGVRLDAQLNRGADGSRPIAIHAADSPIEVWVVPTDEGLIAAQQAATVLQT